jgi:hypothetical protein
MVDVDVQCEEVCAAEVGTQYEEANENQPSPAGEVQDGSLSQRTGPTVVNLKNKRQRVRNQTHLPT